MAASSTTLSLFKRTTFTGRSDKYSPPDQVFGDLTDVLKGVKPVDVSGSVLNDSLVRNAASRLAGYRNYADYYAGRHFTVEYAGGDKKTVFNFCRKIINKRAAWVCGRGFSFLSEKGNELVSDLLDRVWMANQKKLLVRKTAKVSLCLGDAFWYFSVKTKDARGKDLPKNKWYVSVNLLNPAFVFPIWMEDNPKEIKAVMIQFPVWGDTEMRMRVYTSIITMDSVRMFMDREQVSETKNVLGLIPVVHVPSCVPGDTSFGSSCLDDIIPLNDEYNELSFSAKRILKYHGEPTTLVFGAKLSQMERGANKVWSNLPPPGECDVKNLEMQSDLAASDKRLDKLENLMYHHGQTPSVAFDSKGLAVSNTSGIAMQLLFQPLVEATIESQETFDEAILQGNKIITAIHGNVLGEDISELADTPETSLNMEILWHSILPKDEQTEVDLATKKIAMGIWSKAEAARRLSGVKDTEKLALELAADDRYEIATAAEKGRALQGQKPNFSASFLSSLFLSEDLLDIAGKIGDLTDVDGEKSKAGAKGEDDVP